RRLGSAEVADEAAQRLATLSPRLFRELEQNRPQPFGDVDAALRQDDLAAARKRALALHLPSGELAVRAAALGRTNAAREQAELALGADRADASARIALAVAADLTGDREAVRRAIAALPAPRDALAPPSVLARLLFAELIDRHVGRDAARVWLGPFPDERAG